LRRVSFRGDESILDIGCGDGKITASVASLVPQGMVTGIDASANMIEVCRQSYTAVPNLAFTVGDVTSFSFEQDFNSILSFSTFHWVEDKERAFKRIFDALKPGGRMVLLTAAGNNPHLAEVAGKEKWVRKMGNKNARFYPVSKEQMGELLPELGFVIEEMEMESVSEFFENQEALFGWLMAWVPHSTGFGPEDSAAYSREIVDSFLAEKNNQSGPIELKAFNLRCQAIKPSIT
jgi:trans-aconitate 2-methyltransferase